MDRRPRSLTAGSVVAYGVRLAGSFLVLELLLHYLYVVAIKDNAAWVGFTPLDFGMLGYVNLNVIWLKVRVAR